MVEVVRGVGVGVCDESGGFLLARDCRAASPARRTHLAASPVQFALFSL